MDQLYICHICAVLCCAVLKGVPTNGSTIHMSRKRNICGLGEQDRAKRCGRICEYAPEQRQTPELASNDVYLRLQFYMHTYVADQAG